LTAGLDVRTDELCLVSGFSWGTGLSVNIETICKSMDLNPLIPSKRF
jgi:hypothetical protein